MINKNHDQLTAPDRITRMTPNTAHSSGAAGLASRR
jgi:hypothetical protein